MATAITSLTETVRAFWAAQAVGDAETARMLMADDVEWTVVGRHAAVARTYRGVEAFFGELIAALGRTFEPGSAVMDIRGVYEDAAQSTVVTHLYETARTRTGLDFENDIVTIMTVEDGRITNCREFMDLHEVRRTFGDEPATKPVHARE
ncbi:MAG: nuclear transport factor 2 family protein [Actinomycetota bacterium]